MKKSAIITGASQGIGKCVAEHLINKDYHLLLIARNEEKLIALKSNLLLENPEAIIEVAAIDVSDESAILNAVISFHEKTKSIDLIFNNAGYVKRGTAKLANDELMKMMNTNLVGAINVIQAALPMMQMRNFGYIVNLCSRSAEIPRPFLGGYAASKAALLAYSESLYKELKDTNIKVTAICPGFVDTDMTADVKEDREKFIKPDDICHAIDFLLALSPSVALKKLSFESIVQIGGYC